MNKVIRFTASWCQPCKALASIMEGIDSTVPVEVVDIDDNQELAMKYNVRGVPTLVKLDETGQVLNRMVGVKAKNLVEEFLND
jgi:thioredoxin 1